MCVSEYWGRSDRLKVASATMPNLRGNFQLVVNHQPPPPPPQCGWPEFWELNWWWAKPLSNTVWFSIVAQTVGCAVLLWVFDFQVIGSDLQSGGNIFAVMAKSFFLGLMSFWTCAPFLTAKTKAGRLLLLGFAVYITIIFTVCG